MANANNENIFDIIDEIRTYLQDKIIKVFGWKKW